MTLCRTGSLSASKGGPVLILAALLTAPGVGLGQDDGNYREPPAPIPVPPGEESFEPLDAEVDAFVRIPDARASFGVTGAGLAVVVIDSGVNPHHISFQGKLLPGRNFTTQGGADDTADRNGHGSNVAGIIAGKELPASEKMPAGVAPDARIIPIKVFPGGQFAKINGALQWVLDNREKYLQDHNALISVVNMSLGTDQNLSQTGNLTGVLKTQRELIGKLRDAGVAVTVSSGNGYNANDPAQGMAFPGICPETVSVGAVFDTDIGPDIGGDGQPIPLVTYIDGAQVLAARRGRCVVFSQRLSDEDGGDHRTDIFAPGFLVTSAGPVPPAGSMEDPARTRTTQDGTSQASPVVAGIVLLLQEHYRNLTSGSADPSRLPSVDLIEQSLRLDGEAGPAEEVSDAEDAVAAAMDNVKGCDKTFRRVDAVKALKYLEQHHTAEPMVAPASTGTAADRAELRTKQFELFRKGREGR